MIRVLSAWDMPAEEVEGIRLIFDKLDLADRVKISAALVKFDGDRLLQLATTGPGVKLKCVDSSGDKRRKVPVIKMDL